jgi:glycosyltransferase involved in cell wall biosynthesis
MEHYVNSEKLKYVPNPINLPLEYTTSNERNGFLFIGRLVPQKSVDTLVKAFCIAKQHFHGWTLDIVGDGPELNKLKAIVHQNQAEDCVVFHGYQTDVSAYYKKNAIFILPSLYEGLPNVLLEAMTFSMPIIVSDSCPGSVELTAAGECGVTFPANDYVALSSAMADLAKDKEKIKVMGKNSRTKVADFKTPNVLDTWHKIIFEENGC